MNDSIQLLAEKLFTDGNTESLVVNTMAGDDTVIVHANESRFVRVITGDGNDLARVDATRGITGLRFDLGDGDDTANVNKSVAATFVQVRGGRGDDVTSVGLDSFGSGLYDGEDGSDRVNVAVIGRTTRRVNARDSGATGADTLFVHGTSLVDRIKLSTNSIRNGVERVFFNGNTESLTIDTSFGNDTITVTGSNAPNTTILGQQGNDNVIVTSTSGGSTILIDTGIGNDNFTIGSTTAGSQLILRGQGGDDEFRIGSSQADNNGNLGRIRGVVTINGGIQDTEDRLTVNDHGANSTYDYFVSPTIITNLQGANSTPRPNFAGLNHSAVEFLRLDGTDKQNYFAVRPSMTTRYYIDGNLPTQATVGNSRGDFLNILGDGSDGRTLGTDGQGNGVWRFTNGLQDVRFESIEGQRIIDNGGSSNRPAPPPTSDPQNRSIPGDSGSLGLAGSLELQDPSSVNPDARDVQVDVDNFFADDIDNLGFDWI